MNIANNILSFFQTFIYYNKVYIHNSDFEKNTYYTNHSNQFNLMPDIENGLYLYNSIYSNSNQPYTPYNLNIIHINP